MKNPKFFIGPLCVLLAFIGSQSIQSQTIPYYAKSLHPDGYLIQDTFYMPFMGRIAQPSDFTEPTHIAVADINRDNLIDVLTYSSVQGRFAWYSNSSNQVFSPLNEIDRDLFGMTSMQLSDIDADGDHDIVAFFAQSGKIQVFTNTGVGIFTEPQTIVDRSLLSAYLLIDINGDALMDIVIADQQRSEIVLYQQQVDQSYTQRVLLSGISGIQDMQLTDFNGDSLQDLILTQPNLQRILFLENQGNLSFTNSRTLLSGAVAAAPTRIISSDIDGDADQDLVVYGVSNGSIYLLTNDGEANFGLPVELISGVSSLSDLQVIDIEGDGDFDILYADRANDSVFWIENLENETFGLPQLISAQVRGVSSINAADLNGDGHRDVIAASREDDRILWYPNVGGRNFPTTASIARLADVYRPDWVHVVDLNGDAALDVLVGSFEEGELVWYPNDGMNGFDSLRVVTEFRIGLTSIEAIDFDGDSDVDILVTDQNTNRVMLFENDGEGVFTGGTLSDAVSGAADVVAVDINQDGNMDFISAARLSGRLTIHYDDGNSDFASNNQTLMSSFSGVSKVVAADLNLDNRIDIVAASASSGNIQVFLQQAASTFSSYVITGSMAEGVSDMLLRDINRDGLPELLIASESRNRLLFYRNDGSSLNGSVIIDSNAGGISDIHAYDLDGDDDLDILAANTTVDRLVWYENSVGVFGQQTVIDQNIEGPSSVTTGDIDNDGVDDIVAAFARVNNVSWYRNGLAQQDGTNQAPQLLATIEDAVINERPGEVRIDQLSAFFNDPDNNPIRIFAHASIDTSAVRVSIENDQLLVEVDEPYIGSFVVTITATDGNLQTSTSFNITSTRINQAPQVTGSIENLSFTLGWASHEVSPSLDQVFTEPDGQSLSYSLSGVRRSEIQASIENERILLQEVEGFTGTTNITVFGSDGELAVPVSFSVTVIQPNRPPTATNLITELQLLKQEETQLSVAASAIFEDPDGDELTLSVLSSDPLINATANGSNVVVRPAEGAGKASLEIQASDGEFQATTTLTIWVRLAAPVISYPTESVATNRKAYFEWTPPVAAHRQQLEIIQLIDTDTVVVFSDNQIAPSVSSLSQPLLRYGRSYTARLLAFDQDGNQGKTTTQRFSVINSPSSTSSRSELMPTPGLADTSYRMISLPGSYFSLDAGVIFDSVGTANTDWAVFEYRSEQENPLVRYTDRNPVLFEPGKALWYLSADTAMLSYDAEAPELSREDEFNIELRSGWNMIASPFMQETVSWSVIQQYNTIDQPIWSYDYQWSQVSGMQPFGGYFLYSEQADTLAIPYGDRPALNNQIAVMKVDEPLLALGIKSPNSNPTKQTSIILANNVEAIKFPYPFIGFEKRALWFDISTSNQSLKSWKSSPNRTDHNLIHLKVGGVASAGDQLELTQISSALDAYSALVLNPNTAQYHRFDNLSELDGFALKKGKFNYDIWVGDKHDLSALEEELLPKEFAIKSIYPNPFNPSTTISIQIPQESRIQVEVFDILGQKVANLHNGVLSSGVHQVHWNAAANASGLYLVRLISEEAGISRIQKITLIK